MAPATGRVHRALPLYHQGSVSIGKRDGDVGAPSTNVAGFAATIAILAAIIIGGSPFDHTLSILQV